jgi:hypothetical protein
MARPRLTLRMAGHISIEMVRIVVDLDHPLVRISSMIMARDDFLDTRHYWDKVCAPLGT